MFVLTNGARVRFFSFLGPDVVLGISGPKRDPHVGHSAVKHLSAGNKSHVTTFIIETAEDDTFRLKWGEHPKYHLSWMGNGQALALHEALGHRPGQDPADSLFAVDAVKDGSWFALNNRKHQAVLDISQSDTSENNIVIQFPWNGGDNQVWRTEIAA